MFTDTAIAASLTAIHLSLAMLRRHRSARTFSPFVLPSFALTVVPWLTSTMVMHAGVMVGHLLWLFACEVLAPAPQARPSAPRPVPAPAPAAPRHDPGVAGSSASGTSVTPTRSSPGFTSATVLAVLEDAADIRTFRIERPTDFDFVPGQFLAVRVQIDGKPHVRCYSISSSPDTRGYLEISVRKQGLVSSTLHATIRTGSRLSINRPAGQFVYPSNDDRPLALIAGGIGITPLMAMLRHAIAADPTRPVTLLYSARHERDLAFLGELRVIAQRHPQVRIALTLTQPQGETRVRQGRIDAAMVRQHIGDPAHTIFCLCGPKSMLTELAAALEAIGVPRAQIRSEEFETAVAASVLNAPARTSPAGSPPVTRVERTFRVTFAGSGRTTLASPEQSLLDVAESEGIAMASSCRAGVCQACRTRLADGEADCRSDVLADEDRQAGFILPCVTFATGDCVLEA